MDDQTAERIHRRVDETHKLITEVKISYATQSQEMKNLSENINKFINKVDKSIFHTEDGFIVKTKTKLSSLCTQVKSQWYLITLIFAGILYISWNVLK